MIASDDARSRTPEQDAAWQAARRVVLARDRRRCVECGAGATPGEPLHVHHLVPRSGGGADLPSNLITLCPQHHGTRHANMLASLARRTLEHWALRLARFVIRDFPEDMSGVGAALRLFGKERFREGQFEIVLAALRGQSVLAVMPTGSGKSLCFQIPAVLARGTSVVVSPLKALMSDQVMALYGQNIPAGFINSDLSPKEKRERYTLLEAGAFKLLYCAPERFTPDNLLNPEEAHRLLSFRPAFLVIDEAHCVDRWGDAFRPDYARLGEVRRKMGNPPVLAFTATAGRETQSRIMETLGITDARRFIYDVDRPNISFARRQMESDVERASVALAAHRRLGGRALIFVPTVKVGERVVGALHSHGAEVPFYHGQLPPNMRELILARFQGRNDPPVSIVVCTNAFGMGLDLPDIRLVVHWAHPASVEDYVQEVGRAGRDGHPSVAMCFPSRSDAGLQKFMAERSIESASRRTMDAEPVIRRKRADVDRMAAIAFSKGPCIRQQLLRHFGQERRRRSTLFMWLLASLFSVRRQTKRASWCCDVCEPGWLAKMGDGRSRRL